MPRTVMSGISNPIDEVVSRFGGQSALARLLGTKQQTVYEWVRKCEVPYARVMDIIDIGKTTSPPIILCANDFFRRRFR